MRMPCHVFKAYDIRGLVGTEISPEGAFSLGQAYAAFRQAELPDKRLRVVVGRDMRESSPELAERLIAGLTEGGTDVLDIGLVSTPTFYDAVGHLEADGGIVVSASHNPATYNGFKLTRDRAVPIGGPTGMLDIADLVERGAFTPADVPGTVQTVSGMTEHAVASQLAVAGVSPVNRFRIVADTANGMGAEYLEALFEKVPADVTRLYWDLDGRFPNHEADPLKEENMADLQKSVLEMQADIGIATDGDGDRIFFVDNEGEIVPPAILRGLLAQIVLRDHPGATVCYDIRPGKITEDMIREAGGQPVVTKVGHSLIKQHMREVNAVFGGESSGHFFYAFPTGVYEGPVTVAVQILQEITRQQKTLADLIRPYRRYAHSGELNFRVADKDAVLARIKAHFSEGTVSELDGITITYPDFWFNVRASNTESLLRVNLEAVDQKTMEAKRDEIVSLVNVV
ncbi:phosphomannomutase/phosphoglucomutase [Candidatus Uhrbacteria bacterium]|nr:phosphomannomutase/phosphoglucomutase [Candidatus Uhrbacteria bacterium]